MKSVPTVMLVFFTVLAFAACRGDGPSAQGPEAGGLKRIISLSPSITRQVLDLDAGDLLVGVTTYHPPLNRKIEIVGTLVNPGMEKIVLLKPDLVLFSAEDGATQKVDALKAVGIPLFMFERNEDFESVCANYIRLGQILGREEQARKKIRAYEDELVRVRRPRNVTSVVFLVSHVPLITVSSRSFIGHIIDDAGGSNPFARLRSPYPVISLESLVRSNPRVIIVMTPGGDAYLKNTMKGMQGKETAGPCIYPISTDHVPYYTPADYIESVKTIAELISRR